MLRTTAAFLALACAGASSAQAQGILNRAGEALDNAGRSIRNGVETAVARSEVAINERSLAGMVSSRIRSDKRLAASTIQMEVQADGTVILRGSASDAAARAAAVDLVENTIGVATVVDELALVKDVKVIETDPAPGVTVIKPAPGVTVIKPAPGVVAPKPPVVSAPAPATAPVPKVIRP